MQLQTAAVSKKMPWAGYAMSALAVVFLLFDGVIHIKIGPVVESFTQLGYSVSLAVGLGILELVCLIAYVVLQASILGAILLTGYLGGAVATQVRVGGPLFTHVLFPVYLGALLWGGLVLREDRLRALIPLRRGERK